MDGLHHIEWIFPLIIMAMCFFGWIFRQPRYRDRYGTQELKEEIEILREEIRNLKKWVGSCLIMQ
jgi:hypothetical protein